MTEQTSLTELLVLAAAALRVLSEALELVHAKLYSEVLQGTRQPRYSPSANNTNGGAPPTTNL